ncbi:MAG: hypothetical protein KDA28_06350, partial [Phycisphaerales bacterium]|nr:hypothetical protein [Phycisphaerales bacterium]
MRRLWPIALTLLLSAGATGCKREPITTEPPLRPILYTEAPPETTISLPGFEEWITEGYDPVAFPSEHLTVLAQDVPRESQEAYALDTPEGLMMAAVDALLHQDEEALRRCMFEPEMLSTSARMGLDTAREEAAEILAESLETMAAFDPGPPSQARPGGLGELLEPGQLVLGRGRNIDGSLAERHDVPVMHWGSEMSIHLIGTNVNFTVRFSKLLIGEDGLWRLAAAPTVDSTFIAFRAMGMDLKPEMMDVEHAPFPLAVGNYWQYRTRRPGTGEED